MKLTRIPGVNKKKARALLNHNFWSLESVAYGNATAIDSVPGCSGNLVLSAQEELDDFPTSNTSEGMNRRAVCYCPHCGEKTKRRSSLKNTLHSLKDHMNRCKQGAGRTSMDEHNDL